MANLRRTKLKAKRCGCKVIQVDKCNSVEEVLKLMQKLPNTPKEAQENVVSE